VRFFFEKPLTQSLILHLALISVLILVQLLKSLRPQKISFEVIRNPVVVNSSVQLQPIDQPIEKPEPRVKQVFGLSKKSLKTSDTSVDSVQEKAGNTVAKEMDDLILDKDDPQALPIPTDEYLVKSMPVVLKEVRAIYPELAREKGIEGAVILEVLVDQQGKVRNVKLIQGPGFGLNEAALQALWQFEFRPATTIEGHVAVIIRYTYRFSLRD
jgi:protein TonB